MGRPAKVLPIEDIGRRHESGEPISRIAASYGVHNERVRAVLESAGIDVRLGAWREFHPRWNGGRYVDPFGYVMITLDRDDPLYSHANKNHNMREHRYVMSKALGRLVTPDETVHHIDGNRQNNAIENLQLRHGAHGEGTILTCADCGSHNVLKEEL